MTETTRTARLIALMAGNGFLFSQIESAFYRDVDLRIFDHTLVHGYLLLSIVSFAGISGAYFALTRQSNDRFGNGAELMAIATVSCGMVAWIGTLLGFDSAFK